jgi:hypothetical protein
LAKRLAKHSEELFVFLLHPDVPADNNHAYAARGISVGMPTSGLCRVSRSPRRSEQISALILVADAA